MHRDPQVILHANRSRQRRNRALEDNARSLDLEEKERRAEEIWPGDKIAAAVEEAGDAEDDGEVSDEHEADEEDGEDMDEDESDDEDGSDKRLDAKGAWSSEYESEGNSEDSDGEDILSKAAATQEPNIRHAAIKVASPLVVC